MDKDRNHDRKKRKHDGDESARILLNQHGKKLRQSYQVGNPVICEDVLRTIISHMNMKDAARVSLLSSRWKRVSSSPLDLCFTGKTVLGEIFEEDVLDIICDDSLTHLQQRKSMRRRTRSFLKNVDKYLERFATTSQSGINKFELRFCFYYRIPYVGSYLDKWIQIATAHPPRELIIDLWNSIYFNVDPGTNLIDPYYLSSEIYILPCHLFMDIPLERLFLRFSALQLPSNFNGFKLLKRLDLRKMKVSQEDFNNVVSGCHRLEELRVEKCWDLEYLKLSLTSTIKHLVVRSWKRLRKITLSSKCIISFEYTGRPIIFTADTPLLSSIFFCFKPKRGSDGMEYLFTRSYHDFPQMKTLFLGDVPKIAPDFLPPSGKFAKLKRLFVNIPQLDLTKVDLLLLSRVLNESPQLETFHLCVLSFRGSAEDSNEIRRPPMCPHNSIREFQTNFSPLFNHLELMIYVVENAVKLETIIIDRHPVYYKGDHQWTRLYWNLTRNRGDEDTVTDHEEVHINKIVTLVNRTSSAYRQFLRSIPQSVNLIKR